MTISNCNQTKDLVLMLNLHTFSYHGGVAQVSKNLSSAVSAICTDQQKNFKCLSLYDDQPDGKYLNPKVFKGFKQQKLNFLVETMQHQMTAKTIILTHINLLPLAWAIRRLNKKASIVLIAHGIEIWSELSSWKKSFLKNQVTIWAVSDFTKSMIEKVQAIPNSRIQVLHNSLDRHFNIPSSFTKPEYLLERYGLLNQKILLSVTRMSHHDRLKGYDKVITAMPYLLRQYPNLHYLLCGSQQQTERERLKRLITELKMERHISIIGFLPNEELTDHYLLADTFVLPSRKEGFGIAFIEAAICGCAVVAGNQDGSREALLNGELGILIDPDDPQELQKGILQSLQAISQGIAKSRQGLCLKHFSHAQYENNIFHLLKPTAAFQ